MVIQILMFSEWQYLFIESLLMQRDKCKIVKRK